MEEDENELEFPSLGYIILTAYHPDTLSLAVSEYMVSEYMKDGWKLHGDLILQSVLNPSSPSLSQIVYVQAICKYPKVENND
jgi:hypothetical protein